MPWAKRAFRKICSKTGGEAPSAGLTAILAVFLVLAEKLRYFRPKSTITKTNKQTKVVLIGQNIRDNFSSQCSSFFFVSELCTAFKTFELLRVSEIPNPKSKIITNILTNQNNFCLFVCLFICFCLSFNNFDWLFWD